MRIKYCLGIIMLSMMMFGCSVSSIEDGDLDGIIKKSRQVENKYDFEVRLSDIENYVNYLFLSKQISSREYEVTPITYKGEDSTYGYVIHFEDGWQLLSCDKRSQIPLMKSKHGNHTISHEDETGISSWAYSLLDEVKQVEESRDLNNSSAENISFWNTIDPEKVNENHSGLENNVTKSWPIEDGQYALVNVTADTTITSMSNLTQTHWSQSYNKYVPLKSYGTDRCPAGCVPVALAQYLYYLHFHVGYPTQTHSHGYCTGRCNEDYIMYQSNPSSTIWSKMELDFRNFNSQRDSACLFIATLGKQMRTAYTDTASSTSMQAAEYLLTSISGRNPYYHTYDKDLTRSILESGQPVILCAWAEQEQLPNGLNTYHRGHAFLATGYIDYTIHQTCYYEWRCSDGSWPDSPYFPPVQESFDRVNSYFYMNWGWGYWYNSIECSPSGAWQPYSGVNYQYYRHMLYL